MHPVNDIRGSDGDELGGKTIVLGITGSIAAVECVKLCRKIIRLGADVHVVMTESAVNIIHPDAMRFASGNPVITKITGDVEHVRFFGERDKSADLLLIAPCTANTISKIACGIDDSTVTTFATTALGSNIPILIAPAMHSSMYRHQIILENIRKLKRMGIKFVEPKLEEKKAKMASIEEIVDASIRSIINGKFKNKKVLIIGGSTREFIDHVRCITNISSGITAVEIARQAYIRGADVDMWLGDVRCTVPSYITTRTFVGTSDLEKMVRNENLENYDLIIVPAAISDYTIEKKEGKLSSDIVPEIKLKKSPKILEVIRERYNGFIVGFKAEVNIDKEELIKKAKQKLDDMNLDMIVANDLTKVMKDVTSILIIDKNGYVAKFEGKKRDASRAIFDVVERCYEN